MTIERFLPSDPLKPFVKLFMLIESEQGVVNRLLPSTSMVLAFRCRGSVRYADGYDRTALPASVVTGLRNSLRLMDYSRGAATLLVIFQEGGAAALFRESLHELFGISVSLDNLIHPSVVSELEDRIAEAKSSRQRISIVEQFLLARLLTPSTDRLVQAAIEQIRLSKGTVRMKELLNNFAISQDPFEKRFRRIVGTSPKQFSAIVRLRTLIEQYSPQQSLTETAHLAGYFDQAHFIKDFKTFTGQTPAHFFKNGTYW
ncbi:helix-turn-helix domain-containing protein [Spirosoma sp. KNUC1025]|uniref:helix-turn-helix domain-containing protein n=1 Tax=Spirosoma sp. KNUC1025 TaxID=2894082 RepID=UPI003862D9D0|nr:helix-turn-helix domain-containing protein [Spirosoma sp. KNUC1025]